MRKVLVLILATAFLLTNAQIALAHTLKTDGLIGAVLHIDPNDTPIPEQASNIFFEIKDASGKFNPSQCSCLVTISQNSREIFTVSLLESSSNLNIPAFNFTFPKNGVYKISLIGDPKTKNSFQDFHLTWDIRVEGEQLQNTLLANNSPLLATGFIIFVLVIFAFVNFGKGKAKHIDKNNRR